MYTRSDANNITGSAAAMTLSATVMIIIGTDPGRLDFAV